MKEEKKEIKYDVVIIGAGPAGLGAAIYASRSNLSTIVFEKGLVGGQIVQTAEVENYPGFDETVSGYEIVSKMQAQALRFNTKIVQEEVTAISPEGLCKIIETDSGTIYRAKAVIFCAGAHPRKLAVPGEQKFTGRGVSYCATCDGALYRGKKVAVIGGGDSAVEEAIFLTKFAEKVYLIHRRDKLRAVHAIQHRAFQNSKIEYIWDTVVKEIEGDNVLKNLVLYNRVTGNTSNLAVNGVFIYIGIIPHNELIESSVELDSEGFILTDKYRHTNIPGFFAAGDIIHKVLRQVVTAVSDGATAAFSAEKWIEDNLDHFK